MEIKLYKIPKQTLLTGREMPQKMKQTNIPSTATNNYLAASPSKSIAQFNVSQHTISQFNPQQQFSSLQQNDQLFKLINLDNGNGLKDCKAMLDMMKEEFLQEKQKLSLFYQHDLGQLLDGIKVNDLKVKQVVVQKAGKEIQSKIRNLKMKKRNQVFHNYSKLLKHSLRQNERLSFLKQSSKISHIGRPSSQSSSAFVSKPSSGNPETFLDRIMQQKRNKFAIENSSKMNQEYKQLEQIMKNRSMCQKILEQALMFERYYHILKQEKKKVLEGEAMTGTGLRGRRVKTQANFKSKNQQSNQRYNKTAIKRLQNPNSSITFTTSKPNNMCMDPKQLRLPQSLSSNYLSQQEYYRSKYMVRLKRDEYLKQLNRVNEQIVEKKNSKNNCLIGNVLGLIRDNTLGKNDDKGGSMRTGGNRSNTDKKSKKRDMTAKKQLTGPELTKILRRLFLLYTFTSSQSVSTLGTQPSSHLTQASLRQFLSDFQIIIPKNNQKMEQILQKDSIDEFQFIQLIHLLSANMHQTVHQISDSEGMIYTNINYWISKKIMDKRYASFVELKELSLIKKLYKDVLRLRKYHRLEDIVNKAIEMFIHQQRISKLKTKIIFQDFDYFLQMLWFLKIYPQYVNKNTLRFFFEYLKEDKHQFILPNQQIKLRKKQYSVVENAIWLVVAYLTINNNILEASDSNKSNKDTLANKSLDKIFTEKFKLIANTISQSIESSYSQHLNQN